MKVLRTIPVYRPRITGPVNQASRISEYVEEKGHESPVHTSTKGSEGRPQKENINGVPVRRHNIWSERLSFRVTPSFVKTALWEDYDILHSHNYRDFLTEVGARAATLRNKPFVLHNHGTLLAYTRIAESTTSYKLYDWITRMKAVRAADVIVTATEQESRRLNDFGIDDSKIVKIPAGKDIDKYQAVESNKPDEIVRLLFVGRVARSRNPDLIIRALVDLPDHVTLRVVGPEEQLSNSMSKGYIDELEELCADLGVSDRVMFTGPKYDKELTQEYRNAHAFVYPSDWENFGQTMLEAAASELPVIATPEGVAPELIDPGKTGQIIKYGDPGDIASKVSSLLGNDIEEMGKQMGQRAEENYDWDEILPQYAELYNSLAT
jgi:glycosyltransferase involved in cell wall biosynthesis